MLNDPLRKRAGSIAPSLSLVTYSHGSPNPNAGATSWGRASQWSAGPGKLRSGPDMFVPARQHMERGLLEAYPDLHRQRRLCPSGPVDVYRATVPVIGSADRRITVEHDWRHPGQPCVCADGPTASPHRYAQRRRHQLCIWHPTDPASRRWVPDDGFLVLFGMIGVHLFKEAWWRNTGEWLGDEAPHAPEINAPGHEAAPRAMAA